MDVNGLNNMTNNYTMNNNTSQYTNDVVQIQPTQPVKTENQGVKSEYKKEDLDKALNKLNNFLKDEKTHAEYSIHKDLGTLMIKIVDENTKEVLLECPPKKILDMIASMCKQVGLLDRKA